MNLANIRHGAAKYKNLSSQDRRSTLLSLYILELYEQGVLEDNGVLDPSELASAINQDIDHIINHS